MYKIATYSRDIAVQMWLALLLCSFTFPVEANAYLDLTTGSYVVQGTFMMIVGSIIFLRAWLKALVASIVSMSQKRKAKVGKK